MRHISGGAWPSCPPWCHLKARVTATPGSVDVTLAQGSRRSSLMSSWLDVPAIELRDRQTVCVTPPRVLLDTNVWNYIVDAGQVEVLRKAARASGVLIVACPAVVYECLRIPDAAKRKQLAKALTREDWVRLMPEAFSETEDVRRELQRLRPSWCLPTPDLRLWRSNREDWRGGFWRRVRQQPTLASDLVKALGDDQLAEARDASRAARKQAASLGLTMHTFKWNRATATFATPTPGWDGKEFDAWRAASVSHWWIDLIEARSQTTLDWLGPWFDLAEIRHDQASWTHLWTREVSTSAVPREWIRWAMAETQATRSTSNGTPGDNQLATYLLDVDCLISSDKVFVDLVEAMRPHCPTPLAQTHRAPAGNEALTFVVDLLPRLA